MSINIGPASVEELRPRITVIGVGGAGGNAISNMIESEIEGVDFVVANTDAQALNNAIAEHRIQLGPDITQGLGAGSRPEVGRAAAEETVAEIERALEGVNMVFIAAGMGGGTGTGAAPVIAEVARSKGILTVGVVTKPFLFEGTRRMRAADAGIDELQKHVDTLIVIPNQNLFLVAKADTTFKEAFQLADEVLQQGVRSITDLMVMPGLINLDFADVRSVMNEMGKAMMGTGEGEGENRALEAAERAIANPLLDGVSMQGAKGVIISIIGGEDMRLLEVDEAANHIRELVDPEANIIWGSAFNPDLDGKIRVSVVATGIEQGPERSQGSGHSPAMPMGRGPKKPVLPLPTADELADEDQGGDFEESLPRTLGRPQAFDDNDSAGGASDRAAAPGHSAAAAVPSAFSPESFDDADDTYDDVESEDAADGDIAPDTGGFASLAGTRIERDPDALLGEPDHDEEDYRDAFDLTEEIAEPAAAEHQQDELLLGADRLAEADEPVQQAQGGRRRRFLGGSDSEGEDAALRQPEPESQAAPAGNTLFERMANLSRSSSSSEQESDEDDDQSGPSVRIPRFLGRQNNQ